MFGESYGLNFHNPDFVQLAAGYGIKGIKAENPNEFETNLKEALQTLDEIVLIEVAMQN